MFEFKFLIGVRGTNIVRTITANVYFYLDGSSLTTCPNVTWPNILVNKTDNRT